MLIDTVSPTPDQEGDHKPDADRDKLVEACKGLEKEPAILAMLQGELTKSGFAGSTQVSELVFLSMFTRLLDLPVSLLLKGPSGSGNHMRFGRR
jgi:hypothetical protein